LPPNVHSYALLPIGYPMGRFGPVRRVPLTMSFSRIGGISFLGTYRDPEHLPPFRKGLANLGERVALTHASSIFRWEGRVFDGSSGAIAHVIWLTTVLWVPVLRHTDAEIERTEAIQRWRSREDQMPSILNEALEWLDRAEQAREVAGQLTDPGARKAAVLELAESFDRLARAAATPAVIRRREPATKEQERSL